jgi:hypothetical protein
MSMSRAVVLAMAAFGLWGCASQRDVLQAAPPGPVAQQCVANIADQGSLRDVFTDTRATRLVVSNEGGWCGTYVQLERSGYQPQNWVTGAVSEPPAHGAVRLRKTESEVHVEYRSDPGYVGPDAFAVQLQPGFSVRPTNVQVVAAGSAAGVPHPEVGVVASVTSDYPHRSDGG